MGHHGRGYGYNYDYGRGGHGAGLLLEALARMPRGVKIGLLVAALVAGLIAVALAVLVAVALVNLLAGGALPAFLQEALDFARRNLQPLLDFWKSAQGLTRA